MARQAEDTTVHLIDSAAKLIRQGTTGEAGAAAERFLQLFFAHVPPDDLRDQTPENLAGAAQSVWSFAQTRKPGRAEIRLYNPTVETHGWSCPHTVVEIVNDDMPFLVDSVTAAMNRRDIEVRLIIHPILPMERDETGKLVRLGDTSDVEIAGAAESCMLLMIEQQPMSLHAEITTVLEGVLNDVRLAVEDWRSIRQRCRDLIRDLDRNPPRLAREEVEEAIGFLEWLDDDHFTFLGYREYRFQGSGQGALAKIDPDSGLGLLRNVDFSVFDGLRDLGKLPPDVQDWVKTPELLRITKANRRSTVHRDAHIDAIAVKLFDNKNKICGERLFIGLFTSAAYSQSPREIPQLKRKVDKVLQLAGFSPASHDGKALLHILETYPRDELFQIDTEELQDTALGVLHLQERQRTALFVRRDPFERFVSCMVYVPRDRFDTNLRLKLQGLLAEAYAGRIAAFSTQLGDALLARLHVIVKTTRGQVPKVEVAALERQLAEAARSWTDTFEAALVSAHGEQEGLALFRRYERAFPTNYREAHVAKDAVADLAKVETTLGEAGLALDLYRPHRATDDVLHFKLYIAGHPIPLSDVLPMLEQMGLRVISEVPYEIRIKGTKEGGGGMAVWIHDFSLRLGSGQSVDLEEVRDAFHEVFALTWTDKMEGDRFNGLVLAAGLTAQEIRILRAYAKYLRQAGITFSQSYMEETLAGNPAIAAKLAELFETRFDPARRKGRKPAELAKAEQTLVAAIETALEAVANLDEDRILRRFLNAVSATLRTNYYQTDDTGRIKPYISFKLDSRAIEDLPEPKPYREIFVYAPQVEGVHLRFGPVARGGLRWSDRREDFRTEVLGLVKAQQVKNAVIVPVGSKGGFVPKRLPPPSEGREAFMAEGVAAYKTFIRGLLDITDNTQAGKIVPPRQVVRHDGDDPYLVVAADKGTATFSDYANGVSQDYGFWLDDAFASGGSAGYDHKVMGITARGAWESVKRHFREVGKDIQRETFTAIGVGDMSGDVFGNGMLLSKQTKLVAAFNHLHVFVDPDPDPAKSFAERKRLFALPRSTWDDYNKRKISKGGGVFDRKAKSVTVSPEMQTLFGLAKDKVTPNELIRAILTSDVELLWFGGIGTYVKASDESNLEVGDRTNDALRINGEELRCRVVGEGANLGMTQPARIEYALKGGRLNTDSIDNSAGVDCSDHEVNIKILLGAAEQNGKLTRQQRDKLLAKMTDEVAELVLRDNYLQTQSISVTQDLGGHLLDRLGRYMRSLERAGRLNRALEHLPDDETIEERMKANRGLTRPEIAILLSYAKIALYDELLDSDLPDDPALDAEVSGYFPTPLRKDYADDIRDHRLRREIAATLATNETVNRMGISFVHEVREKTGYPAAEIVRAFMVARDVFDLSGLWAQIEALDNKVPAEIQASMLIETGRLAERVAVWMLRVENQPLDIASAVARYRPGVAALGGSLESFLTEGDRHLLAHQAERLRECRVPKALADTIAGLYLRYAACDLVRLADLAGLAVEETAQVYFTVGARFGFDWLRRASGHLANDTAWDKLAITAIVDDLDASQFQAAESVLDAAKANGGLKQLGKANGASVIDRWVESRRPQVLRSEQLLGELRANGNPDFAMLAVANRQLKSLVDG
ncbi:NAD-glutamate dehydrogenase [Algihabitans albus]|uniref:NAD-glutamate dehydrogenase n=1 Tax=Algihabitans albus TaxID=2164067 RepID=UPI000E5C976C|nr:NAD-glutamate dehydrogenase [Algihabitans albus]